MNCRNLYRILGTATAVCVILTAGAPAYAADPTILAANTLPVIIGNITTWIIGLHSLGTSGIRTCRMRRTVFGPRVDTPRCGVTTAHIAACADEAPPPRADIGVGGPQRSGVAAFDHIASLIGDPGVAARSIRVS